MLQLSAPSPKVPHVIIRVVEPKRKVEHLLQMYILLARVYVVGGSECMYRRAWRHGKHLLPKVPLAIATTSAESDEKYLEWLRLKWPQCT